MIWIVSIHAPRAGCDIRVNKGERVLTSVSIHAPRAGCDASADNDISRAFVFQFTHPVRGATSVHLLTLALGGVSIHAPRAGCDTAERLIAILVTEVSIHAPRAGCD